MSQPNEKLMQTFIKKELHKDNRIKADYRIFNRETKSFYKGTKNMTLSLGEIALLQINGENIPEDCIVIQRYIGVKDCNGKKIYEGDYLLTNEGNWCGFVVFCHGMYELTDAAGGYSAEPEWGKCEVIAKWMAMCMNVSGR